MWQFSWLRSCSLTELTRQITPATKNSHAPPPIESRKGSQPVNPYYVWTWWVFPCWVKLSHRLHSWWCPSINSFFFSAIPTWLIQVGQLLQSYVSSFSIRCLIFLLMIHSCRSGVYPVFIMYNITARVIACVYLQLFLKPSRLKWLFSMLTALYY